MGAPVPLHIVSLGCARNEADSEELAARFLEGGFSLVSDVGAAEVVVVNTCGFIEAAKSESIEEILGVAELKREGNLRAVVAVGCLAQRYGAELAASLPEADAIIGFDGYEDIAGRVRALMGPAGRRAPKRLPGWLPQQRVRLSGSPMAPLKIASGCDRRCTFCAIPAIRGPLRSRPVAQIVNEARWLAAKGVKELFLVSENTTAYGKDLAGGTGLEALLAKLSGVEGIERVRLSYLLPSQVRPPLIEAVAATDRVAPYFDLPFQHAARAVLARMGRRGDAAAFLDLLERIRVAVPGAGIRSNVIVGFPGETEADVAELTQFLGQAQLDAVGVFAYSDEEGTPAAELDGHLDAAEIAARVSQVASFVDTVSALRAEARIGEDVTVLVESVADGLATGRAGQQGPEDGRSYWRGYAEPGEIVTGRIGSTDGVDWNVEN